MGLRSQKVSRKAVVGANLYSVPHFSGSNNLVNPNLAATGYGPWRSLQARYGHIVAVKDVAMEGPVVHIALTSFVR